MFIFNCRIDYSNKSFTNRSRDKNSRNSSFDQQSYRLNEDLIERKLFERIFLHKSAFISIDLRNCLLSITTLHSDRDDYTRITKQDSNPVKVAHRRRDDAQPDIGMHFKANHLFSISITDSSRNRLLSVNRFDGFEFTRKSGSKRFFLLSFECHVDQRDSNGNNSSYGKTCATSQRSRKTNIDFFVGL